MVTALVRTIVLMEAATRKAKRCVVAVRMFVSFGEMAGGRLRGGEDNLPPGSRGEIILRSGF